ncbi:hypothetical protein HK097_011408 [Rhizophlyctis rosea]|uniref:DUF2428 domain-containing protein n=1 Tax=Rhizophlyctis rosea TaxID=64517 RepID=A0AAD5WZX9_9FUNG|nr:hypothetical protein HK097_011408 [Rhizophlyctis rosea]
MPKQPAPLQKRPVKVFHIREEWIQIYETAAAAPAAARQQAILKSLQTLLNKDASQVEALAGLRRLQSALAKSADNRTADAAMETYTLVQTCLIPIFMEVHFARTLPHESSFRSAVFSVIATAHEVVTKISDAVSLPGSIVQDELQYHYNTFLQSIQTAPTPLNDALISHFGAVLLTSLDRPVGRTIVEERFEDTFQSLAQNLAALAQGITTNTSSAGQMATKLHLAQKFDSCNDLLKVTVGLVTKFPGAIRVDNSSSKSQAHSLETLLAIGFQICFSSDFMPENQFMAGILIGTLLNYIPLVDWASALFGGPISNVKFFDIPAEWDTSCQYSYAALAVYRGLMSTMQVETLASMCRVDSNASIRIPLLSWMYSRITAICDTSTDSNTRVLAFQTLATWLAIVGEGLEKGSAEVKAHMLDLVPTDVCQRIFAYVFDGWEDPIDTIQHKLKDVFQGLLDLFRLISPDIANEQLQLNLNSLLKADWHRKVKYDLLSIILSRITPDEVLRLRPDFLLVCFDVMRNPMMASRIAAFIMKFFKEAFSQTKGASTSDNRWWLEPVVKALTSENHVVRRYVSEVILVSLMKAHKSTGAILLSSLTNSSNEYVEDRRYKLHATIAVLKAGRLLDTGDISRNLKDDSSIFEQAVGHPDLNLRIDVLGFLSEAQKATADFIDAEFPILKSCLLLSLDNQSPEFRQRVYGHLQKLLRRVRRTLYANWRDYRSRKDYMDKKETVEKQPGNHKELKAECDELVRKMELKKEFLRWLCDVSVTSIFPGSSFQRGNSNLLLMNTILDSEHYAIDGNTRVDIADLPGYPSIVSSRTVQVLLGILFNDSYVPNRQQAFDLLTRFPNRLPGLEDEDVRGLLTDGLKKAASIRSLDSEIGSVIVRLVFAKYVVNGVSFVQQLLDLTEKHVEVGRKNLYLCATEYPMHGIFGTLQAVLAEVRFDTPSVASNVDTWRDLADRCFNLVKNACDAVLDVCTDASPEGNLPASFADMQQNMENLIADAGDDIGAPGEKSNEAQLILYQCFHTIKEATGVLRTILCSAPLPAAKDDEQVIIRYERIVEAGNLLKVLLASIRHRGAFSAVHVCFADVCSTLLSSGKDFLADLPRLWLDDFLAQVMSLDVSITRRSAGLPLGVLAVVSAPVPSRPVLLASAMDRLFTIGMQDVPEETNEQMDLPQVHAYNIIRAIFQDAEIATEVRDWMGQGFALTIKGFSSPSFPIRNGAAMLFTTLITKALGTKKTRDESHSVNTVTGREFFTRFPNLHSLLLTELSTAVDFLEKGKVHPALHPILTTLVRLKPSPLESADAATSISAFEPIVARCASTSIFKLRDMAGRAYAPLIISSQMVDTVKSLLAALSLKNQNQLHGSLLLVQNLLRAHLAKEVAGISVRRAVITELVPAFSRLTWVYTANPCSVTHELFIAISREYFVEAEWLQNEAEENLAELEALAKTHFAEIRTTLWNHCHAEVWKSARAVSAGQKILFAVAEYSLRREQAEVCLKGLICCGIPNSRWADVVLHLLDDRDYEVQLTTIDFIPELLKSYTDYQEFGSVLRKLAEICVSSNRYYRAPIAAAKLLTTFGSANSAQLFEFMPLAELAAALMRLLQDGTRPHCAEAFLPLLGSVLSHAYRAQQSRLASDFSHEFARLIKFWSHDEQPLATREAVFEAIERLELSSIASHLTQPILVQIVLTMMKLMEDDDSDVRENVARVAAVELLSLPEPVTAARCRVVLGLRAARDWVHTPEDVDGFLGLLLGGSGQ